MKQATRDSLEEALAICEDEDRSTEYIIQFLQDYTGVDFDCVMSFLTKRR